MSLAGVARCGDRYFIFSWPNSSLVGQPAQHCCSIFSVCVATGYYCAYYGVRSFGRFVSAEINKLKHILI